MRKSGILMCIGHIIGTMELSKFSSMNFGARFGTFGEHLCVIWSQKRKNMTKWNFCSIVFDMKTIDLRILKIRIFNIFLLKFCIKLYKKLQDKIEHDDIIKNNFKTDECCVCLSTNPEVIFVPCAHLCSCMECGQQLSKCPLCRRKITNRININ